ncbi:MAG: type I-PGING CRISPR-associated protein Cas8c/Csp2 [Bacteroidetes bacterium]|nr:type I-PGING CRISPR-associated protein Cas8c/Csp2 [Bacteroidota bacterium]
MIAIHPYIRYAQALIMSENDLKDCDEITAAQIIAEIENGLNSFRVQPIQTTEGKDKVKFDFAKIEKGDPKKGVFLAPNILSKDKFSRFIWNEGNTLSAALKKDTSNKLDDISMSVAPIAGEYLSFSLQGNIGRGNPKVSLLEKGLSAITTLTQTKPCLQYRINKKGMPEMFNVSIIPDLPIKELKSFIQFFKWMLKAETSSNLMYGNVVATKTGKGITEKTTYEAKRPLIFKGNFPNPPRSSALGSIALLGAIGEFAKEAKYSERAKTVLDSLKGATMYLVKYGGATTFTYNHHVINLAKDGKLKSIVDSLYYTKLYNQDRRSSSNSEYQKFDLFTSRFLQLFNHAAFKDFLAFRAEYPIYLMCPFHTYFIKMEKIDPTIVSSARELGKWLNKVAYFTAKAEVKVGSQNYWEELRRVKSKVLIELESSTFSSKSGDALVAQAVTRAGRLSGLDAPEAAALFMERTASGELPLENAKNLLIAFSRLINKAEKQEMPKDENNEDDAEVEENIDHTEE